MNIVTAILTFFMVWWVTLFIVLPFGIRGQWEEGGSKDGSEPGAPIKPQLVRKFFITTGIALMIWALVYTVIVTNAVGLISFDWLFGTAKVS